MADDVTKILASTVLQFSEVNGKECAEADFPLTHVTSFFNSCTDSGGIIIQNRNYQEMFTSHTGIKFTFRSALSINLTCKPGLPPMTFSALF